MWTITVAGEARDTFFAMLNTIQPGWIVSVEHPAYSGDVEWIDSSSEGALVFPRGRTGGRTGPSILLDYEGLDSIHVY